MAIDIGRRQFLSALGGTVIAWPLAASAQQSARPVIGYLYGGSAGSAMPFVISFRRGLMETGYTEGQNVSVEYRWADSHVDRLPALADELVRGKVAVIVSTGSVRSTAAAVAATKAIPVVFITGTDPVMLGWVQSFNHPGGNVTGVSFLSNGLMAKRLSLLHDTIPRATVVGVLLNPENPTSEQQTKDLNEAAGTLGLTLLYANVARESDVEPAFNSVLQRGAQAIAVATEANFLSWFVINLSAAKSLGLEIPSGVLAIADEVIE
jgi:putative ABC transport system substrate-binding protein